MVTKESAFEVHWNELYLYWEVMERTQQGIVECRGRFDYEVDAGLFRQALLMVQSGEMKYEVFP